MIKAYGNAVIGKDFERRQRLSQKYICNRHGPGITCLHCDDRKIVVSGVSKYYPSFGGRKNVLNNISFSVSRNMNIGILGRNGAGKSTLINILAGAEYPNQGTVKYNGIRLSWPIGNGGIQNGLTGRNNVKFICRVTGNDIDKSLAFIMDFTELGRYIDMPVKTYSAGMKARLAFAMSMIANYECYLIDEGFNAGDRKFTEKSKEIFSGKLSKSNMIVVSHNKAIIRRFCNCACILDGGHLKFYDDIEEAIFLYENAE